ncbi:MAG: aminoacyl-tRNA hydrolase [Gaiellales bacterium]|nr:aminoacyl-tRNA hydrolase [Gaiellales bacterium]
MTQDLSIRPGLAIPGEELTFTTSRSSGPGGQHVNKTSTRVTLAFSIERSPSLSSYQKALLKERLGSRINAEGILRVVAGRQRSQLANHHAAVARFVQLLQDALQEEPERVATKPTAAARERRLSSKRRRARVKRERGPASLPED